MEKLQKIANWIMIKCGVLKLFDHMSDEKYLKLRYMVQLRKRLNLKNPKTLCEKLQWLKLYNRRPEYTQMVDKYEAKKYVADLIGEEHIIPTYGVWERFDDIDFDSLPDEFILKCTHDSGSFVVCKDKKTFDFQNARNVLEKGLSINCFNKGREWPYKNVKPRIIAEKYFDCLGKPESIEYKTTCFNGKVGFVTICTGIAHSAYKVRTNDHFDKGFNRLPFWTNYRPAEVTPQKPEQWNQIIEIAEKLSKDIPYLRVDTYIIDGVIYFGELTFFTWSGFMKFNPPEYDRILGDMLTLPEEKRC